MSNPPRSSWAGFSSPVAQSAEQEAVNFEAIGSSPIGGAYGCVAQSGERLPVKQEVAGSKPVTTA
jgi:hypothetical protein